MRRIFFLALFLLMVFSLASVVEASDPPETNKCPDSECSYSFDPNDGSWDIIINVCPWDHNLPWLEPPYSPINGCCAGKCYDTSTQSCCYITYTDPNLGFQCKRDICGGLGYDCTVANGGKSVACCAGQACDTNNPGDGWLETCCQGNSPACVYSWEFNGTTNTCEPVPPNKCGVCASDGNCDWESGESCCAESECYDSSTQMCCGDGCGHEVCTAGADALNLSRYAVCYDDGGYPDTAKRKCCPSGKKCGDTRYHGPYEVCCEYPDDGCSVNLTDAICIECDSDDDCQSKQERKGNPDYERWKCCGGKCYDPWKKVCCGDAKPPSQLGEKHCEAGQPVWEQSCCDGNGDYGDYPESPPAWTIEQPWTPECSSTEQTKDRQERCTLISVGTDLIQTLSNDPGCDPKGFTSCGGVLCFSGTHSCDNVQCTDDAQCSPAYQHCGGFILGSNFPSSCWCRKCYLKDEDCNREADVEWDNDLGDDVVVSLCQQKPGDSVTPPWPWLPSFACAYCDYDHECCTGHKCVNP